MKLIDLTGQRFTRLEVVQRAISNTASGKPRWVCFCDCGKAVEVAGLSLRNGDTRSCGCLQKEKAREAQIKHGGCDTTEYCTWANMLGRCRSDSFTGYYNYGGRGIEVCERWLNFENFLKDMGKKPSPEHSIERIDNDGNYCPENCKWATRAEQSINKRNNKWISIGEKTKVLTHWLKELKMDPATFYQRLNKGWGEVESLTTPTARDIARWTE